MMFRLSFMMLVAVCLLVAIDAQAFAGCKRCGRHASARHSTRSASCSAAAQPSTAVSTPAVAEQPITAALPAIQQAVAEQPTLATTTANDCLNGICNATSAPHVPAARILAKFRR